jgi:hypothetical protein
MNDYKNYDWMRLVHYAYSVSRIRTVLVVYRDRKQIDAEEALDAISRALAALDESLADAEGTNNEQG